MRTLTTLGAAAALLVTAPAPLAAAEPWSKARSFPAASDDGREPTPRAAIAADGTGVVAFYTEAGALMLADSAGGGRFGAARVVQRRGGRDLSIAAAPGGAFLLAWEQDGGLHAVLRASTGARLTRHRYVAGPNSTVNSVQVAADPRGGWVIARNVFGRGPRRAREYGVRVLSLDRDGRRLGRVQNLGTGVFGTDTGETQSLAVGPGGRAVLAFESTRVPVAVVTRPHGGAFGRPLRLTGADPVTARVVIGDDGRAVIAATQFERSGEIASFGRPVVAELSLAGALGPPRGPALSHPGRAFAPGAAPLGGGGSVLVFQLKTGPAPFSLLAPVRAIAIAADGRQGARQTLTSGRVKEPVVVALAGGRALALWTSSRGVHARLARPDGIFERTSAPQGAPPPPYHGMATNRDLRTAGPYAIFTWARGGRVRVTVRRF